MKHDACPEFEQAPLSCDLFCLQDSICNAWSLCLLGADERLDHGRDQQDCTDDQVHIRQRAIAAGVVVNANGGIGQHFDAILEDETQGKAVESNRDDVQPSTLSNTKAARLATAPTRSSATIRPEKVSRIRPRVVAPRTARTIARTARPRWIYEALS